MSKKRSADLPPLIKGQDGRWLCRWCQGKVQSPRRTFCSDACVQEYMIRSNPGYARDKVFERDKGVCVICLIDTTKLFGGDDPELIAAKAEWDAHDKKEDRLRSEWYESRDQGAWDQLKAHEDDWQSRLKLRNAYVKLLAAKSQELIAAGWTKSRVLKGSLWDADHTKPVVEGGGECGLDNLRTLCLKCHKKETAELRKRMKGTKRDKP